MATLGVLGDAPPPMGILERGPQGVAMHLHSTEAALASHGLAKLPVSKTLFSNDGRTLHQSTLSAQLAAAVSLCPLNVSLAHTLRCSSQDAKGTSVIRPWPTAVSSRACTAMAFPSTAPPTTSFCVRFPPRGRWRCTFPPRASTSACIRRRTRPAPATTRTSPCGTSPPAPKCTRVSRRQGLTHCH